jgi:hypothetical protein
MRRGCHGNFASCACEDESSSGGNVESMSTVAACADNVVNAFVRVGEFHLDCDRTHRSDRTCYLWNGLAFHAQGNQICTDLRLRGLTRHDDVHRFFGFISS